MSLLFSDIPHRTSSYIGIRRRVPGTTSARSTTIDISAFQPTVITPVHNEVPQENVISCNNLLADVVRETPFEKLSHMIPSTDQVTFTTVAELVEKLRQQITQLLQSQNGAYILVRGLKPESLIQLESEMQQLGTMGAVRFTYESPLESLIVRLMPGPAHEITSRYFFLQMSVKISEIPGHSWKSFYGTGTAQYNVPGKRSKQGDEGFKPKSRNLAGDWPTLVIEVGCSETLPLLRIDAEWWLDNSAGKTEMVLIIHICLRRKKIQFELWEMLPNSTHPRTTTTHTSPGYSQHAEVNAGTLSPPGASLIISYNKLFDTKHSAPPDLVFTDKDLLDFAEFVFQGLG